MFRRFSKSTFGANFEPDIRFHGRFILANLCVDFMPEFEPMLKCADAFPVDETRADCPSNNGFSRSLEVSNPSSAIMRRRLRARP